MGLWFKPSVPTLCAAPAEGGRPTSAPIAGGRAAGKSLPLVLPHIKAELKLMSEGEVLLLTGYRHLQREKGGTEECDSSVAQGMSLSSLTMQRMVWKSHIREMKSGMCWLGMESGVFLKARSLGALMQSKHQNLPTYCPRTECTQTCGRHEILSQIELD